MDKKFKLTKETKKWTFGTLYRIQALKSFGNVKKGDLGGWIECEKNLSQEGKCWVYDQAKIFHEARVFGDAQIRNNASISGFAKVFQSALVKEDSEIGCDTSIYGNAIVGGRSRLYDFHRIASDSTVFDTEDVFTIGHTSTTMDETITFSKSKSGINVVSSWLTGNIERFEEIVKMNSDDDRYTKYLSFIRFAKTYFEEGNR